jgi:hypothetical protein
MAVVRGGVRRDEASSREISGVYGQARFDAQPVREGHEVNPVLDIAVLRR